MEDNLLEHYQHNRDEIEATIEEFRKLRTSNDTRIFQELSFVIFTSQSSAENSWSAARKIGMEGLLELEKGEIAHILTQEDVAYENRKADYIIQNREFLSQPTFRNPSTTLKLKSRIRTENLNTTRKWFAENIKGISWKGSSHFLRNIGYGDEFAILSQHTLSVLADLDVLAKEKPPKTEKEYLSAEKQVQEFSKEIGINIQALDLVLWSLRTGKVFK